MITKFIGTASEVTSCESIALVMIGDNSTLTLDNLKSYTLDSPVFIRYKIAQKSKEGKWIANFNSLDYGFILNNLVMYNKSGDPIGFVDLTQQINITKYGIESVELLFDYVTTNKGMDISVNISYKSHRALTAAGLAHKKLFDTSLADQRAITKSELSAFEKDKQVYTKNIITALRNPKLIYRYSGSLYHDNQKLSNLQITIPRSIIDNYDFHEVLKFNDIQYLFSVKLNERTLCITNLHNGDTKLYPEIGIINSKLRIGANYIITGSDLKQELIKTVDLLDGKIIKLNGCNFSTSMTSSGVTTAVDKPYLSGDINFAKDPITKELLPYRISNGIITPLCSRLKKSIETFNLTKVKLPIVYASEGLLFLAKLDELGNITCTNTNDVLRDLPLLYTHQLPGTSISPLYSTYSTQESEQLQSELNNLLLGTNVNDLTFLSNSLLFINKAVSSFEEYRSKNKNKYEDDHILIQDESSDPYIYYISYADFRKETGSNKYLVEVASDFDYTIDNYGLQYRLKIHPLQGGSGIKNYDKIMLSITVDSSKLNLISLASDGKLFGFKELSQETYMLTKL